MPQSMMPKGAVSRRSFLAVAAAGVVVAAVAGLATRAAHAARKDVQAAIKALIGDATPKKSDKITIKLPQIAENGNTVPLTVIVDSPMTAGDHVKVIHLFAEGNPRPDIATFHFGPHNGQAEVSTRIRLLKTQTVVAVVEMSNGSIWRADQLVKVTIGGCGG